MRKQFYDYIVHFLVIGFILVGLIKIFGQLPVEREGPPGSMEKVLPILRADGTSFGYPRALMDSVWLSGNLDGKDPVADVGGISHKPVIEGIDTSIVYKTYPHMGQEITIFGDSGAVTIVRYGGFYEDEVAADMKKLDSLMITTAGTYFFPFDTAYPYPHFLQTYECVLDSGDTTIITGKLFRSRYPFPAK